MKIVNLFIFAIAFMLVAASPTPLISKPQYEPQCLGYINDLPYTYKFTIHQNKLAIIGRFSKAIAIYSFNKQGRLIKEQEISLPASFISDKYERQNNQRLVLNDRYLVVSDRFNNSKVIRFKYFK